MATVPDLEDLKPSPIAQTSKVYAIDGSLSVSYTHLDVYKRQEYSCIFYYFFIGLF